MIKHFSLTKPNTTEFRNYKEFDNHEMLIGLTDEASGLSAYIGIHNTNLGPALGGTRLQAYRSEKEAIADVLNLSKAMSYKCALANLPYGGGKGVIILNGKKTKKSDVLAAYARMVENLRGLFKTGTDVGISDMDVITMAKHTSHMLGVTEADRGELSTSNCAALGVFYSMKAALLKLDKNDDFNGKKVAIKGVGKLGGELARLLDEAGAEVIIADIEKQKCLDLQKRLPKVKIVDVSEIHAQDVDIYAPCALGNEFTPKIIAALRCRAVVGGANNLLPNSLAGDALFAKGVLYAPDYIANSGGLIYVADELEPGGFNKKHVIQRVKDVQSTMASIFQRAAADNQPTHKIADIIARERIANK